MSKDGGPEAYHSFQQEKKWPGSPCFLKKERRKRDEAGSAETVFTGKSVSEVLNEE